MRRALLLTLVWAATAAGQPATEPANLPRHRELEQTYRRLAEAERKLLDGKAAEAAEAIQHILDESGDDLVTADGTRHRPARQVVQLILTKLPPDQLRVYRARADEPARQLLAAGKKERDPRPLRALLDRYFVSRPAEEALLLLGELAFERGDFHAAEGYWRRLLPSPDPTAEPSYPDPTLDPASVRARLVLAAIFAGELERAKQELADLQTRAPKATGRLAGRDGPYVETLQALLAQPPRLAADRPGEGEWSSFGGSATRTGRTTARLPYYWPGRPTWKAALPAAPEQPRALFPRVAATKAVAFHPVVLDGVAYVADTARVFGYDVRTGQLRFAYDLRADPAAGIRPADVTPLPVPYDADFTLTAADGHLFARLGSPAIAPTPEQPGGAARPSLLVGFARPDRPGPGRPPLEARWILAPPGDPSTPATWEGAPLWVEGRLYAVFARFNGNRLIHAVACYDDPPDKPLWVVDICDSAPPPAPPASDTRYRHELLTYAGGNLVFCSHTGLVVAVEARSGKPAWAFRYPRMTRSSAPRDLAPPVADGGRVFVAPTDADRVFALDALTGRPLWQTLDPAGKPVWGVGPLQVDQLLGVTRGRLVCTIAGPNRGIRGLNVATGSDREPEGWAIHDDPQLASYGRGLVSDELIVWPTKSGLFLLSPEDGLPLRPPVYGPQGNLAYADGVLVVATPTEVWGYVAERTELPLRKNAIGPEAARRRALALADAQHWQEAERVIAEAEPVADPTRRRAEWLADRAERALAAGQSEEAQRLLREMLRGDFPLPWRARAAARLRALAPIGEDTGEFPAELESCVVLRSHAPPIRLQELIAPRPNERSRPPPARAFPRQVVEFDPAHLHGFGPTLAVGRETLFPSPRCVPLVAFDGIGLPGFGRSDPLLLVTDGSRVLAYRPDQEMPLWETALPAGLAVTQAVVEGNALLAAGPRGVVRLNLADGRLAWSFTLPDVDPLPTRGSRPLPRSTSGPHHGPGLSDFALAGARLIARVGDHHLLALDTQSGRVAWCLDGLGRERYTPFPFPGAPRFGHLYFADPTVVVVQLSTGVRWSLDPFTGQRAQITRTAEVPWEGPPVRLGSGRLAVADGPGLVTAIGPGGGRSWAVQVEGEASFTGQPPQLRAVPEGVVLAVARNHGIELERRFGAGGTPAWREGVLLPVGELNLAAADTDLANLYLPAEGRLFAVRLNEGRVAWTADLPGAGWRVRAGRKFVLAYPESPVPTAPLPSAFPLLNTGRLPVLLAGVYDAWTARTVPLLVLDAETGQVRHRLDLPALGPVLGVHLSPGPAVVATAGKAYWLK